MKDLFKGFSFPAPGDIAFFLFTTLLLCSISIINGYPLIYSDSGTYMASSFSLDPPIDRPVGYGIFIRLVTWQATMWTVVIAQNMLINVLLAEVIQSVTGRKNKTLHLISVLVLTLLSSVAWYSNQIMPDVFTGILVLTVFLLTRKNLSPLRIGLLTTLLFFTLITHFSHILQLLLFMATAATAALIRKDVKETARRFSPAAGVVAAAILFNCFYHYANGKGFRLSLSSNVFLTARFSECGVLKQYLDRTCAENPDWLCEYKDSLPNATAPFLWDYKNSPLYKHGGWEQAEKDFAPVIKGIITSPWMWKKLGTESAAAWGQQLTEVNVGSGLSAYGQDSPPYFPIRDHIKNELPAYLNSYQNQNGIDLSGFQSLNRIILCCGLLICLWFLAAKRGFPEWKAFFLIWAGLYIWNAFVTGAMANVYDRLQARITWPLLLATLLAVYLTLNKTSPSPGGQKGSAS